MGMGRTRWGDAAHNRLHFHSFVTLHRSVHIPVLVARAMFHHPVMVARAIMHHPVMRFHTLVHACSRHAFVLATLIGDGF